MGNRRNDSKVKQAENKGNGMKLTITMLVSNRIDTIRKCMDSIRPILEQVSSELIVVDTGSTDGSMDVVREYTDKIVKFTWCNDFSKARNAGLEKASGEWVMFLDDDEWFEDVSEIIDFFNTGEYRKYNRGVYRVRNYGNMQGGDWSDSNAPRMLKHFPDICFKGKIHEYISPQVGPTKFFDVYAHHYGYVFATQEERWEHSRRNLLLLEEEIKQNPEEIRLLMQMVQEYFFIGEKYRALELCKKVLEIYRQYPGTEIYAGYCYVFSLRSYVQMRDWKTAYEWGERLLEEGAPTVVGMYGAVREMLRICRKAEKYEEGLICLKKYLELHDRLKTEVNREEICLDLSSYFEDGDYALACMDGLTLGVLAGNWKVAEDCLFRKDWKKERPLLLNPDTVKYIMDLWATCDFREEFLAIADVLAVQPKLHKQIDNEMERYQKENTKGYRKLLYLFASCADISLYTDWYRLLYYTGYGRESDKQRIAELVCRIWKETDNPLLWVDEMWEIVQKENLSLTGVVTDTGYSRWFAQVRDWLEMSLRAGRGMEKVFQMVYCGEDPDELHFRFLKLKYEEGMVRKELEKQDRRQETPEKILSLLIGHYDKLLEFYLQIYDKEMFTYDMASALPTDGAFAVYMELALQCREEGNQREYLRLVAKAAECYPVMKELCKRLLQKERDAFTNVRAYDEEMEFFRLAEQLKQNVKILLENGKREEARQVVQQLKGWIPADEELDALMNRCLLLPL